MSSLDVWDYVSMSALVTFTCGVGLYQAFKVSSSEVNPNFLVANRELSVFSLVMSIAATIMSTAFLSGYVMEVYTQGLVMVITSVVTVVGAVISVNLFLPVFYQLNKHTVYEYLELRFSSRVRLFISLIQGLQMTLVNSVFIYGIALVLQQATKLELWASVCVIGVSCTVYTSLGGFKAVVWSDVAQQSVVYSILLLLIIRGMTNFEGVGGIWERLEQSGRSNVFTFIPDPNTQYSFWTLAFGCLFTMTSHFCVNQTMIQRAISTKSLSKAKMCLIGGATGYAICFFLVMLCGAVVAANYVGCDPQIMGLVKSRDQMLMLFAVDSLSFCKGLTGVFLAGLICAAISSVSSYLNSITAITMSDYIRPLYPNLSTKTTLRLSKIITFIIGAVCMVLVVPMHQIGGLLRLIFSVSSVVNAPTATIFTVGMLFPWVNTKAAVIGTLAGVVVPYWAIVGNLVSSIHAPHLPYTVSECSNLTDVIYNSTQVSTLHKFYTMSPLWYICWSVTVGLVASLVAAKIIGLQDSSKVDPLLLFPFVRRFVKSRDVTEEAEMKLYGDREKMSHE